MDVTAWAPIFTTAITTLGVVIGAYLTYLTRAVHTAVNSERTQMVETVTALNAEIRRLSSINATLAERLR